MLKRAFDLVVSIAAVLVLLPLLPWVAILIKLDSPGPVFFKQERVGRSFRPFWIYKFRSMSADSAARGLPITAGRDSRITRIGSFLRKTKIDELPQLVNIIKGDMSLVGPRPELPRYVQLFRKDYEAILAVRPGITDLASIKYSDEAALLGNSEDPEEDYITCLLPDKIRLAKQYVARSSIWFDLELIFKTLPKLFSFKPLTPKGPRPECNP